MQNVNQSNDDTKKTSRQKSDLLVMTGIWIVIILLIIAFYSLVYEPYATENISPHGKIGQLLVLKIGHF